LCNTIIEVDMPVKLVGLIKMCSYKMCSKVYGLIFYNAFCIQNDLRNEGAFLPLLFNFAFKYATRRIKKVTRGWN
jgi:hypothetical protein